MTDQRFFLTHSQPESLPKDQLHFDAQFGAIPSDDPLNSLCCIPNEDAMFFEHLRTPNSFHPGSTPEQIFSTVPDNAMFAPQPVISSQPNVAANTEKHQSLGVHHVYHTPNFDIHSPIIEMNEDPTSLLQEASSPQTPMRSPSSNLALGNFSCVEFSPNLAEAFEQKCTTTAAPFVTPEFGLDRRDSFMSDTNSELSPLELMGSPPDLSTQTSSSPPQWQAGGPVHPSRIQQDNPSPYRVAAPPNAPAHFSEPTRAPMNRVRKRSYSPHHQVKQTIRTGQYRRSSLSCVTRAIDFDSKGSSSTDRRSSVANGIVHPFSIAGPQHPIQASNFQANALVREPSFSTDFYSAVGGVLTPANIGANEGRSFAPPFAPGDIVHDKSHSPYHIPIPRTPKSSMDANARDKELENIDFEDITVSELKTLLRRRQMSAAGKKGDLVLRLKSEIENIKLAKDALAVAPPPSSTATALVYNVNPPIDLRGVDEDDVSIHDDDIISDPRSMNFFAHPPQPNIPTLLSTYHQSSNAYRDEPWTKPDFCATQNLNPGLLQYVENVSMPLVSYQMANVPRAIPVSRGDNLMMFA